MVAALADSLFRIPLTRAFVKNFFRLFSNFFASVPRRSPPGEQLVYFTTLPLPLSTTFFLIFNFFQRFVIPVKIRAYRLCVFHRLYKPSPSMLYYL